MRRGPTWTPWCSQAISWGGRCRSRSGTGNIPGAPGENTLIGKGVSFCATCDGFFFRGKDVVVVGGGDSALEEGLFLTRFADRVQVIHRRDALRAGETLKRRAGTNEKMSFVWDSVVEEILGNGRVEGVVVRNLKTDATERLGGAGGRGRH